MAKAVEGAARSPYRVQIVSGPERRYLASMDAQIGMATSHGPIVRFTAKQVITRGSWGETRHGGNLPTAVITLTEAKRWGFKQTTTGSTP